MKALPAVLIVGLFPLIVPTLFHPDAALENFNSPLIITALPDRVDVIFVNETVDAGENVTGESSNFSSSVNIDDSAEVALDSKEDALWVSASISF